MYQINFGPDSDSNCLQMVTANVSVDDTFSSRGEGSKSTFFLSIHFTGGVLLQPPWVPIVYAMGHCKSKMIHVGPSFSGEDGEGGNSHNAFAYENLVRLPCPLSGSATVPVASYRHDPGVNDLMSAGRSEMLKRTLNA